MNNFFTITDDAKLKTSELLRLCRDKFPVWSYWNDKDLDKDFPKPKKATTRYFKKNIEADEENKNKSADDLKSEGHEGITIRERIIMELAYFEETDNHLDIENYTLCTGSRDRDGRVPCAYWDGSGFGVLWCRPSGRDSSLRSRSAYSNPSTLGPLESLLAQETKDIEELETVVTKLSYKGRTYVLES